MIEVDNYEAIELIKKSYTKYITKDIEQLIQKHDFYTNLLIGMMIVAIVCAVIYGYTKIMLFIILVPIALCVGFFSSHQRKVYSKQVVAAINKEIAK